MAFYIEMGEGMKFKRSIKALFLALLVSVNVIGVSHPISALAYDQQTEPQDIELNKTYKDNTATAFSNVYNFMVPTDGTIDLQIESENKYYIGWGRYYIYTDDDKLVWKDENGLKYDYSYSKEKYCGSSEIPIKMGTYYLVIRSNIYTDIYSFSLSYQSDIREPELESVITGKNFLTAGWDKVSGVSGYELQYSTNRKFSDSTTKSVKVKPARKTKQTVKNLKSNKNYYVRVRAYKTMKGMSYRTGWSAIKRAKTK